MGGHLLTAPGDTGLRYAPDGSLYERRDTGGSDETRYQQSGASVTAEWDEDWYMVQRYVPAGGMGAPLMRYGGSNTADRNWYFTDERGSVVAEGDDTGAANYLNRYDEYGVEASGNTGTFGYAGQLRLPGTGLTHNRNRVYNASLGRFMTTDPIGQAGGLNLYGYVGGDPVNFSDPTGLFQVPPEGPSIPPQPCSENPDCDVIVVVGRRSCSSCLSWQDYIDYFEGNRGPFGPLDGGGNSGDTVRRSHCAYVTETTAGRFTFGTMRQEHRQVRRVLQVTVTVDWPAENSVGVGSQGTLDVNLIRPNFPMGNHGTSGERHTVPIHPTGTRESDHGTIATMSRTIDVNRNMTRIQSTFVHGSVPEGALVTLGAVTQRGACN